MSGSTPSGLFSIFLGGSELQLEMEKGFHRRLRFRGRLVQTLAAHRADLLGEFGMHGLVEALGAEHVTYDDGLVGKKQKKKVRQIVPGELR